MQVENQAVFRAVADPTRRAIIELLAVEDMTAGAVAGHFEISRPAVAKHMKILREGGIVVAHRNGRERINRLEPAGLKAVADWVAHYERFWDRRLAKLKLEVEKQQ